MAVSFPLPLANLADLVPIEAVLWHELRQQEMSALGSGEYLAHDLAPPLYEADITSPRMSQATAEQLRARLRSLDGSSQHFYLYNPALKYPQADPDGSIVGSSSVVIATINANRKAWTLSGLPAGYVLTLGDWLEVTYDTSRRALVQAVESATADGSGVTPEFEIRPHLRPGITTSLAVNLKQPAAKVKLLPNGARVEPDSIKFARIVFTARQTLAKG